MIGGTIVNATAFVEGNYLAKYLSSDSAGREKKTHDLAEKCMTRNIRNIRRIG